MSRLEQNQVNDAKNLNSARQGVARLGFWTAILIATAAVAAFSIAITTAPARSGPYCQALVEMGVIDSCITYPYTDVSAFVPTEYIWMYPAFLLSLLFVILVTCVHHYAPTEKKIFSQIAFSFAVISAAALAINYFIQLAVMQPSLLKGELEGLSLFSQYNPHGIFIALEDIGYLMMGVTFLFIAIALGKRNRLEKIIQLVFGASSVLVVGSLIILALIYRSDLEYRYEVFSMTVDWITLIVSGVLLSIFFKRGGRYRAF